MIWVSLNESLAVLVDTFIKIYVEDRLAYEEETICEMIAGEVEYGKRSIEEYYEKDEEGNNILVEVKILEDIEPKIVRLASDEKDGKIECIDDDNGRGYKLIFKRITVTHPLEDVSIDMFAVDGR